MGGGSHDKHRYGIVKGHVTYTMAPFHQKAFSGYFGNLVPELIKRGRILSTSAFPTIAAGIFVYWWANQEDEREHKKHRW